MRIALDAMGGDFAPAAIVEGALLAARDLGVTVVLVGDEPRVRAELAKHDPLPPDVEVVAATQVIEMHESPGTALRNKLDASVTVAAGLVASGQAQAVVSAGNSGAFMGAALWKVGTIEGVARPAIATLLPSENGRAILLDAGANCDSPPKHLVQFALMGDVYARRALHVASPRVALLNIGEESSKGNEQTKAAYRALAEMNLNFIGNIEGTDVVSGKADVIVCDGFVGNIALKLSEGWAHLFVTLLKQELAKLPPAVRTEASLVGALQELQRNVDYSEYGGALLVGVKGVAVFGHGRSNPKAILGAVRVAKESVETGVVEGVASSLRERNMAARAAADHTAPQEPATN